MYNYSGQLLREIEQKTSRFILINNKYKPVIYSPVYQMITCGNLDESFNTIKKKKVLNKPAMVGGYLLNNI